LDDDNTSAVKLLPARLQIGTTSEGTASNVGVIWDEQKLITLCGAAVVNTRGTVEDGNKAGVKFSEDRQVIVGRIITFSPVTSSL
jgi:hypothetical protein